MEFRLYKIENENKGTWYFTTLNKAASALGILRNLLEYYYRKNKDYKGWNISEVDGSEIKYKYINPDTVN